MINSDHNEEELGTDSPLISDQEDWLQTDTRDREQNISSAAEVYSVPMIGTIYASSNDEEKQVSINPSRVEKAIETIKKNNDIERRGF